MKNLLRFLGITALVAVTGFAMVSCGGGGGGGGGTPASQIASTSGSLTITGLSAYDGKYVTAQSMLPNLIAAGNISTSSGFTGVAISGGSVTLKVWKADETGFGSYSGNEQDVEFLATILGGATATADFIDGGTVTVDFTDGKGTGVFRP